ncbi:hypothetical protein L1887_20730 [Cichorium endivia]|nr:hypothetical protein L1887_20730 [Cichorium endivia]
MLEKEEAEAGKEALNDMVEDEDEQKPEKLLIISEVSEPEEKDSESVEIEFWMPPVGDRWDFDNGKDRWASGSESDDDPESDDAKETCIYDATGQESNETQELSNRTKRMSIEIEPSYITSSKKKKKIQST